jgi:hypothetical protein
MRLLSLPYISENRPQCLPVLRSSFSQPQQFHHSRGSRTMMRLHTTIYQYTRVYHQVSPSSADHCAIYSPRHSPYSHFYSTTPTSLLFPLHNNNSEQSQTPFRSIAISIYYLFCFVFVIFTYFKLIIHT